MNRRRFIQQLLATSAVALIGSNAKGSSSENRLSSSEDIGVLVDVSKCIGCRKCEFACNQAGDFDHRPVSFFEDMSVMKTIRKHDPDSFTVINEYQNAAVARPVFLKTQCHHCLDPACYSACLVTAFDHHPEGPVTYDVGKCMGCRYCMVACPFEIPAFEYERAATPRIRKCNFCLQRLAENKLPACVEICPVQCMTFGHRADLIHLAHTRIGTHPGEYINHVYGETEVGGTSWMYISSVPFESIGLPTLSSDSPPRLLEGIQHSIFKACLAPLMVAGFLGGAMVTLGRDTKTVEDTHSTDGDGTP